MAYTGFTLSGRGDWYLARHGLTLPKPFDLQHTPPHLVGRELDGRPIYQGFYALTAVFNVLSQDMMQALFAYYIVGDDAHCRVTVGFEDPYQGSAYRQMNGYMHEPQIGHMETHFFMDVAVRFSHLQ